MKSRIDWRIDIPCAFCGRADLSALTLAEWEELQWEQWRREAAANPQTSPTIGATHISTARDRYGWRRLPGTTWLGPIRGFGPAEG